MAALASDNLPGLLTCLLVFARVLAMLLAAPMFGHRWVALRNRLALGLVLSLIAVPFIETGEIELQRGFLSALLGEIIVGLLFGLGIRIALMALPWAGDLISRLAGFGLGTGDLPGGNRETESPLGQLFLWIALAVFIVSGGPNQVVLGLLNSFAATPPGSPQWGLNDAASIVQILQQTFEMAVRVAAPVVVALIIATLLLGLLQRSAPTMNSFQIGFALKSVLACGLVWILLTQGQQLIGQHVAVTLDAIIDLVQSKSSV